MSADNNHVAKIGIFLPVSSKTLISTVTEVTLRDTLNTESWGTTKYALVHLHSWKLILMKIFVNFGEKLMIQG